MASKPDKSMSSRLMTMKFMQRAAASTPPSTPSTPSGPPHKRQRLSNGTAATSSPGAPSDQALIRAALDEEERRRVAAVERQAVEAGETRWVLSVVDEEAGSRRPRLEVVVAGYGEIDGGSNEEQSGEDADDGQTAFVGRKSFGKFKDPDAEDARREESDSSSGLSTSEESGDDEEYDPLAEMLRQERKAVVERAKEERREKKKAAQAEAERMASERRKKDIRLNKITSISGGGNAGVASGITCFGCGQKGHTKRECPRSNSGGRRR